MSKRRRRSGWRGFDYEDDGEEVVDDSEPVREPDDLPAAEDDPIPVWIFDHF